MQFERPEDAQRVIERIGRLSGREAQGFVDDALVGCPNPDMGLANLERWLNAAANPATLFDHLLSNPGLSRFMATLLGASHQLADVLVQNPELSDLVLDPSTLAQKLTLENVVGEGRRLLAKAHSYTHKLDRLRFLKQGWYVRIAMNDLLRAWPEEEVWEALSDLAESILVLLREVVWENLAQEKKLEADCPVLVVAMGKLGGRELNYSSDVDLVYVLADDADIELERHATRFCERFGRALDERMGRGRLFRVDLRLRPFGSSGPILARARAVESYYAKYAEPWEQLALVRSRPIAGPLCLDGRWRQMRQGVCFRPARGEWVVDELVSMRSRLEEIQKGDDLKRGPGGIRDVEFLTQIIQVLEGHAHPTIRLGPTCHALRAIAQEGILPSEEAEELVRGYTLLRQTEHRCQLVGDQQTHALPESELARLFLARSMGFADVIEFDRAVERTRTGIRRFYTGHLQPRGSASKRTRDAVIGRLGSEAQVVAEWLDLLPESESFFEALASNEGSLERIKRVARRAPALIPHLKLHLSLTEQLLSGEIEEPTDADSKYQVLGASSGAAFAAALLRSEWLKASVRWVLSPEFALGRTLVSGYDRALSQIWSDLSASFSVIALGSYASYDLSPESDLDLLLLAREGANHRAAEKSAQAFMTSIGDLRRLGGPFEVDLRLRPEGRKGLLVRTLDGFRNYEAHDMEPWERLALGRSRLIWGDPAALTEVRRAAFGRSLDSSTVHQLAAIKHRIETERVSPQHFRRHVKLGWGGLDDIDWLAGLGVWESQVATDGEQEPDAETRLHTLFMARSINAVEHGALVEARLHHVAVRNWLMLLGFEKDIVPENPDKLSRLAEVCGFPEGNAFLAKDHEHREAVRAIFEDALRRLQE